MRKKTTTKDQRQKPICHVVALSLSLESGPLVPEGLQYLRTTPHLKLKMVVLPCLVLSCLALLCRDFLCCLVLCCPLLSCLVFLLSFVFSLSLSCLVLSYLVLSYQGRRSSLSLAPPGRLTSSRLEGVLSCIWLPCDCLVDELFCLLLSYVVSCLVLSCPVLPCLVLYCLVLRCVVSCCFVLSFVILYCLVFSCLVLS